MSFKARALTLASRDFLCIVRASSYRRFGLYSLPQKAVLRRDPVQECPLLTRSVPQPTQHNVPLSRSMHKDTRDEEETPEKKKMNLMDVPETRVSFPFGGSLGAFVRSKLNLLRIKSYDSEFDLNEFMKGAMHAMSAVSRHISKGEFDELKGLVADESIKEIQENFKMLTEEEKRKISLIEGKKYDLWVYDIRIQPVGTGSSYSSAVVTIHVSLSDVASAVANKKQKLHGEVLSLKDVAQLIKTTIAVSYWFSKTMQPDKESDWLITKLNHSTVV